MTKLQPLESKVRKLDEDFQAMHATLTDIATIQQRHGVLLIAVGTTLADHTAVLTEHGAKLADHDARFDAIDGRFDTIDARFDTIDGRFDTIDARFDALNAKLNEQNGKFDLMVRLLRDR